MQDAWQNTKTSLWFLPTALGLLAVILSYGVPTIDTHLPRQIAAHRGWLFYGSPDAARTLISTLAGSLITVISLLFSITILTMQQASTQFTSRVLRNFTDDRGVQWVLGSYVATFVYCILILRRVRSASGGVSNFVPVLSITLAILLAVVCVALLVYYVHHIATLLQSATVIERVHRTLFSIVEERFPEQTRDEDEPAESRSDIRATDIRRLSADQDAFKVHSESFGFLRSINEDAILRQLPGGSVGIIDIAPGQYVPTDMVLLKVSESIDDADCIKKIRSAFILDRQRTLPDDVLFGVRQLVDIALRALSPAVNDPTTAEHVIATLSNVLIELGGRSFPSAVERRSDDDESSSTVVWIRRPDFSDFVESSFAQIRRAARNDVDVTMHLLHALRSIAGRVGDERARPVWEQVSLTVSQINASNFIEEDRAMLLRVANSDDTRRGIAGIASSADGAEHIG